MSGRGPRGGTPVRTLRRAAAIGLAAGLQYVYAENLPGQVRAFDNTYPGSFMNEMLRGGRAVAPQAAPARPAPRSVREFMNNPGYCPSCRTLLVERQGRAILRNVVLTSAHGFCPTCSTRIPGVWE